MKILCLNTWGTSGSYEKRWNCFLNAAVKINPEIFCLQEVFDEDLTKRIQKQFHLKFSHSSLPSGLAIISKFEMSDQKTITYQTQSPIEMKTSMEKRRAIIVNLKIGNKKIQVANTHLAWRAPENEIRLGQTKELIHGVAKELTVLAGDFNDVPESAAVLEVKKAGFTDGFESLHPGSEKLTWDNRSPYIQSHKEKFPDRRIDFLFFHKNFLAEFPLTSCEIIFNRPDREGVYPSDHYGLIAEIKI